MPFALPTDFGRGNTTSTSLHIPIGTVATMSSSAATMYPWLNSFATHYTDKTLDELIHLAGDTFWIALLASVPFVFWGAYRRKRQLEQSALMEGVDKRALLDMFKTDSWPTLFGLCELYILGIIPVGPWNVDSIRKRWAEKRYLRRLLHAGIVPLYIQKGGLDSHQEKPLTLTDDFPFVPEMPENVQSKSRAYFEFFVPYAYGYYDEPLNEFDQARRTFMALLTKNRKRYAVHVSSWTRGVGRTKSMTKPGPDPDLPLELGAKSRFEFLLPFKQDTTLREPKGYYYHDYEAYMEKGACPLLEVWSVQLVRIEALDYAAGQNLDEWVYAMAQDAKLGKIWEGRDLRRRATQWIRQNGFPDFQGLEQDG